MRIEIITSGDRLANIGKAWEDLWRECGAGVFQSHRWISAWWAECKSDHTLCIVCAWQDDTLIGILPLCTRQWHGVRILEWTAQAVSDYCDAVVQSRMVLGPMWDALERKGGFDLWRLKHVHPEAMIMSVLRRIGTEERSEPCLQVVSEWPNGEAWFKTLNKKTRNDHSRGTRILYKTGEITFRQASADEDKAPIVHRLLSLKRQRVENRASPLVASDSILLALVRALDALGSLRIFLIEQGGTVIAGSVNVVHGGKMLAVFATYDPTYHQASPGILLMTDYTRWAFDHGITEVDYLLGAEPYKFKFANREVRLHIFVAGRTMLGRMALAIYRRLSRPAEPEIIIGSAYLTGNGTPRKAST